MRSISVGLMVTAVLFGLGGLSAGAQQRPAQPPPPATPPAPAATSRTEILVYDGWTVTCRDGKEPTDKRACSAELQIVQTNNNVSNVIFSWVLGQNNANALVSAFRFPTGVQITPGLELKFAGKEARKIALTSCEQNRCEAATVMDDAFIREAGAAATAEATIYAIDGRGLKFTITMKGFSSAVATIRR